MKMVLKLFNTMTREKEIVKPIHDNEIRLYTCGPTVYDYIHIGNLRSFLTEDILRRVLLFNGFKVKQVMNITDVGHLTSDADTGEDKLEVGARREGKTAWEIAKFYEKEFFKDINKLNILKAEVYPRATDHIKEQIELVKKLEENGYTYIIENDGVYFDTSKFKDYGKMSRMNREKLKEGARIQMVEGKRNKTDFALWKFSPKDEKRHMEWNSPWGKGFPGWHIECSAMSMRYLGEHFDIHVGGEDHITIHHPNERAQAEAATGKTFVNIWMHVKFLVIEGKKMSKSLSNYYKLNDLLEKNYSPRVIRYTLMASHYREQLNFTIKEIDATKKTVDGLLDFVDRIRKIKVTGNYNEELKERVKKARNKFVESINDDLNMPNALAAMFDMIREVNRAIDERKISQQNLKEVYDQMMEFDKILGMLEIKEEELPEDIKKLIEQRNEKRKEGNFEAADKIRKSIEEKGYLVEDTPEGPIWKKKEL
jgi:cysteinyl-tRNA synthetase